MGANDGRPVKPLGATFGNLRPDAYFVDEVNRKLEKAKKPFHGRLWELKPISYFQDPVKKQKATKQVAGYINKAKALGRGCWTAGE